MYSHQKASTPAMAALLMEAGADPTLKTAMGQEKEKGDDHGYMGNVPKTAA